MHGHEVASGHRLGQPSSQPGPVSQDSGRDAARVGHQADTISRHGQARGPRSTLQPTECLPTRRTLGRRNHKLPLLGRHSRASTRDHTAKPVNVRASQTSLHYVATASNHKSPMQDVRMASRQTITVCHPPPSPPATLTPLASGTNIGLTNWWPGMNSYLVYPPGIRRPVSCHTFPERTFPGADSSNWANA